MLKATRFAEHYTEQPHHDLRYSAVMKWKPSYTISNRLLTTIRDIGEAIGAFNAHGLNDGAIAELKEEASVLSCYAVTGLVGKQLTLAELKPLLEYRHYAELPIRRELFDYDKAQQALSQLVRHDSFEFNIKTLEWLQGLVVAGEGSDPSPGGVIREQSSIVPSLQRGTGVYVPPSANDIPPLIARVMLFVNRNIGLIDPVILAGIFYHQLVMTHPFLRGNSRTIGLMTNALLGKTGMDLFELISLENYFYNNRDRYDATLNLEGDYYDFESKLDLSEWLEFFSQAVLHELHRVLQAAQELAFPETYLEISQQNILQYLERHGSISLQEYSAISRHSHASLKADFERLVKLGLIESKGIGDGLFYVLS
jgi:Fic family protein